MEPRPPYPLTTRIHQEFAVGRALRPPQPGVGSWRWAVSALKEHMAAVLVEAEPDERTCTLICLLSSFNVLTRVLHVPNRRDVKRRTRQIFKGEWQASALSAAVFARSPPNIRLTGHDYRNDRACEFVVSRPAFSARVGPLPTTHPGPEPSSATDIRRPELPLRCQTRSQNARSHADVSVA